MRTVNIGALKAKLSAHLRYVKNGEEVLICDRNQPIAKIIPFKTDDYDEHEKRMIAEGRMTSPKKPRKPGAKWPKPPGKLIPDEVMERLWQEEREDR